jgi:hypothetical protein
MSENLEITDQKDLKEIENLWSEWIDFEKSLLGEMHDIVKNAKSPFQNPHKLSKDELFNFVKDVHKKKKLVFSQNEINYDKLLEKTVNILKKHVLK